MNPQDTAPGNPQQQVIERLRTAVNVLVTVSNSPSVDQLAAAVGLTLTLNKMGKHATAVYSGDTPSTIEFLKPEATLEKNTDSLRDFIVSLDKSKADKLRYKVEDNVVRIFITPYRTSLSEKDLNFSQGDFNVDAVIALGVTEREQLDQAIVAHGRILHDATVITVSAGDKASSLGAINWQDASASSLCEMMVGTGELLQPGLLDNQIATAYLTGIVAQTERFRNNKTTPKIMSMSANLMAAGANQQLIASSLDKVVEVPIKPAPKPEPEPAAAPAPSIETADGALSIDHNEKSDPSKESGLNLDVELEPEEKADEKAVTSEINIDEQGNLTPAEKKQKESEEKVRRRLVEPLPEQSEFGGSTHPLTGFGSDDGETEPNIDPLAGAHVTDNKMMLDHNKTSSPPLPTSTSPSSDDPGSTLPPIPESSSETPVGETQTLPPALDDNTLRDIEKTFDSTHIVKDPTSTLNEIEEVEHSPHLAQAGVVDSARSAVDTAINAAPYDVTRPKPLQALNATPFDLPASAPVQPSSDPVLAGLGLTDQLSSPSSVLPPAPNQSQPPFDPLPPSPQPLTNDPSGQSPPPVPPPLLPLR